MAGDPLGEITVSKTAMDKQRRYLTASQLRDALRNAYGRVHRRTSPNHDGLYPQNKFVFRGTFHGKDIDIVFVVEDDQTTVITQMSQHVDSLQGRYYEQVGTSASEAIANMPAE
ncbi:MAG: hypothetical protein A07HR60_02048 [uncultured archaeon A07HR60]|nr:MAG: hypothetical protein A07HR60_02048 [uncultured archaeon A07HR60]